MDIAVISFHWARIENWMANHFTFAIELSDNTLAIGDAIWFGNGNATDSMVSGESTTKTFIINERSEHMSNIRRWIAIDAKDIEH